MEPAVVLLLLVLAAQALVVVLLVGRRRENVADTLREAVEEALRRDREEAAARTSELRREIAAAVAGSGASQEARLERVRETLDRKVGEMLASNESKLEEIRRTVDEKLHGALEQRLGESFRLVSERLEKVHAGLGEMQALAGGVDDLRRLMSNVKNRGTWGETQLGELLGDFLAPEQYATNVEAVSGSGERVEFAVRLPGRDADGAPVLLPIDAKFPQEDYRRLLDAEERADPVAADDARRGLERAVRAAAREIAAKYVRPPATTDFAILFVPLESLYAEVLRRPGLARQLQQESKIVLAGPSTLAALLDSLRMGFRTLAIERRSSEVWGVLGAVKAEFARFGEALAKVQKKLGEAEAAVESAQRRGRAVSRKLRGVEDPEASAEGEDTPTIPPDP